jgi:hypothetical protein
MEGGRERWMMMMKIIITGRKKRYRIKNQIIGT